MTECQYQSGGVSWGNNGGSYYIHRVDREGYSRIKEKFEQRQSMTRTRTRRHQRWLSGVWYGEKSYIVITFAPPCFHICFHIRYSIGVFNIILIVPLKNLIHSDQLLYSRTYFYPSTYNRIYLGRATNALSNIYHIYSSAWWFPCLTNVLLSFRRSVLMLWKNLCIK